MSDDKVTIGLTEQNKNVSEYVVKEKAWFKEGIDAAKFAMALAIRFGIEPGRVENVGTVWNVGSFDQNGELRMLMETLFPAQSDTPYRLVEFYLNKGFELIDEYLAAHPHAGLSELMALQSEIE
jgi:hypothetical protein